MASPSSNPGNRDDEPAAMPMEIVFMRHGQSEANVVHDTEKLGRSHAHEDAINAQHDSEHRLTDLGRAQAAGARVWLLSNDMDPDGFDERYVSTYARPMETAAIVGGPHASWLPEPKIVERDWGVYGATPTSQRAGEFAAYAQMHAASAFFGRLAGGESIYDVTFRVREFLDTLCREMTDKRVFAVCHGELMWAARFVIERLLPHEWQDLDLDPTMKIGNCMILHYSRQDPTDREIVVRSMSNGWCRMVNPLHDKPSPNNGEWARLSGKRRLTGAELAAYVEQFPRHFSDEDD